MAMLTLVFVLVTFLGVVLMFLGLHPRRRGTTPYCRRCGYNLTGLSMGVECDRCPECGADVTGPKAVIIGERRVRRARVVVGLVCLLLGVGSLGGLAAGGVLNVDWYAYRPTGWVLSDVQSNDTVLASKALWEISRRLRAGRLTARQMARLAEICLAEQARPSLRYHTCQQAVDMLYTLYRQNQLTPQQTERYFANMFRIALEVRPRVVAGEELPLRVVTESRGPEGKLRVDVELLEIRVGDEKAAWRGPSRWWRGFAGSTGTLPGTYVNVVRPGKHKVAADFRVRIDVPGRQFSGPAVTPLYSRTCTLEGVVEVFAEEPPDLFTLSSTAELDEAVAALVTISAVQADRVGAPGTEGVISQVSVTVWFNGPRPIGLAFGVFAEFGRRRIALGTVALPAGGNANSSRGISVGGNIPGELPDHVTIVLRSSKAAARRTTDLYEIWDGELRFEEVAVLASGGLDESHRGDRYTPRVGRRRLSLHDLVSPGPASAASQPADR